MRDALSEQGAFGAALAAAAVLGVAALVGSLTAARFVGVALLGLVLLGAAAAVRRRQAQRAALAAVPRPPPPPDPRRPGARHRILVVANESLAGLALRRELLRRLEIWPEVHVVAPVLASRTHYWTGDLDEELGAAGRRLEAVLEWARRQGFDAVGEVGDENPVSTVEDALERLDPDEVIVAMHPPERAGWLEGKVVHRILERPELPVTLVVEHGAGREEIARAPAAPAA